MAKNDDMFSSVDILPACDGQTDGQTSCDGIVRAMHTRRVVKIRLTSIEMAGSEIQSTIFVSRQTAMQNIYLTRYQNEH